MLVWNQSKAVATLTHRAGGNRTDERVSILSGLELLTPMLCSLSKLQQAQAHHLVIATRAQRNFHGRPIADGGACVLVNMRGQSTKLASRTAQLWPILTGYEGTDANAKGCSLTPLNPRGLGCPSAVASMAQGRACGWSALTT
jgi:hypothetical protein